MNETECPWTDAIECSLASERSGDEPQQCGQHPAHHYHVGHNMPGYLPESDVDCYTSWEDAKRAAIDMLENDADHADMADDHDLAESLSSEAEDLNLDNGPEWGTIVTSDRAHDLGTSYWIVLVDPSDCDGEGDDGRLWLS